MSKRQHHNLNEQAARTLFVAHSKAFTLAGIGHSPAYFDQIGAEDRERWRTMASLCFHEFRREITRLEASLEIARKRGFVILDGEPMCWAFTPPGGVMVTVYHATREGAAAAFHAAGVKVDPDQLTPAPPVITTPAKGRDA